MLNETISENEGKARAIGESRELLRARLMEAKGVLSSEFVKIFRNARFDFNRKRMVSECCKFALQWRIRSSPDKPISYRNQQTNVGCVTVEAA